MYSCIKCGAKFTRSDNLRRHEKMSCKKLHDNGPPAKQQKLNPQLATSTNMESQPSTSATVFCDCCNKLIAANRMSSHMRTLEHRTNSCVPLTNGVEVVSSAFKCRIVSYRLHSDNCHLDYVMFFNGIKNNFLKLLQDVRRIHKAVKVNMEVFGRYILQSRELSDVKSFNTPNVIVDQSTDLKSILDIFVDAITTQTSEFQERDSGMFICEKWNSTFYIISSFKITGWALERIMYAEVNINKYSPMGGSSYIQLPKFIQNKNAVVNVKNQDQCCFAWAIISALYPTQTRSHEVSSYPHYSSVLDVTGMNFPVKLCDISKFEDMNNISINVYGLESKFENNKIKYEIVGPLHYSRKKLHVHINLLLVSNECGLNHRCSSSCIKTHYCWIKDLSRLVSHQISAHGHKKYFCDGCLLYFNDERLLLQHQKADCNHIYTTMPSTQFRVDKYGKQVPENILKFENIERQMQVPFVVYADFESILKPIYTCEPNPQRSYTNRTYSHEPYSFAYLIKCSFDNSINKFQLYRGDNAAKVFVSRLETDLRELYDKYLDKIIPMLPLTAEENEQFINATVCGICEKPFNGVWDTKVRDHCHLTGKVRLGAAHSICNLNYKLPNFIPVVFHNMSGYDCHLFIKELCSRKERVDVIPVTKEKYVSFTKYIYIRDYVNSRGEKKKKYLKIRFIDSFKFLSASLQNLGNNLADENFEETKRYFPQNEKFRLMRKKGVFPYSFVDSLDKLNYPILPPKQDFYDNLNEEHITDADYERARAVWNAFGCKSLGDYSDIYLKSDVLLLCDVFENFRKISLDKYKLDPAHYFTAPGLSWDAMLKYTGIELELLTDIDMINFFKKGIRGGISQCSERKHIANNIFLPNYNPEEPSSFITYLDATNLYGHSMSQPLPTGGFKWLCDEEIINLDIANIADDNPEGYILEVDIHYPEELHDLHADLPFLVENIVPPTSRSNLPKLIPNLNDKKKYIVHYRNLKQALRHGLMIMQTHRILKFNQKPWLKKYIDLNTEMRNKATNKFEKDHYKLINNAVYGKTMENVDNRKDIKLVTHWESVRRSMGANALISRPNFKNCSIFSEDFVAIHMGRQKVLYNKPIYLGFCILELSKIILYNFFYDVIKREFGDRAALLYTDTDSLIIKVFTDNFYEFIRQNPDKFDTSNYIEGNKFSIPKGLSQLGKMKDEFPADPIISFYGTGAKAYCIQSVENELKKAKGVKRSVIKKQLNMDDYKKIVENGGLIFRKMNSFRSDLHDIYTEMKNKVALSHQDDKRFIIPNTTKTLPWGHGDITFFQTEPERNLEWFMSAVNSVEGCATEIQNYVSAQNNNLDALIAAIDELNQ